MSVQRNAWRSSQRGLSGCGRDIIGALCGAALLLPPSTAGAGENLFGYAYLTDTQPRGKWELEQWYWGRYGKERGRYANALYRTELEYGVTDNYQISVYTNERHVYANKNNRDGTTGGEDLPENVAGDKAFNRLSWEGISVENIYRLWSPYKDPIGVAVYFEPEFGPHEVELEHRLMLQKNFLEDRLVTVLNFWWALAWDQETGGTETDDGAGLTERRWKKESQFELDTAMSYRFAPHWWAGLESRIHNNIGSFNPRDIEHAAFFVGPNVHYAAKQWWATATALFQLPFAAGYNDEQKAAIKDGRIFGDEHEAVELRVKFGWVF